MLQPPQDDHVTLLLVLQSVKRIEETLSKLDATYVTRTEYDSAKSQAATFVTRSEFWPVQTVVYGGVSLMLTAVFATMIARVIKKNGRPH